MALYLPVGEPVGVPPAGVKALAADSTGSAYILSSDGSRASIGGGDDLEAQIKATARAFVPPGFAYFFTDFTHGGLTDPESSVDNTTQVVPQVNDEGGRLLLTTLGASQIASVKPRNPFVTRPITVGNPLTQPWYIEGGCEMTDRPTSGQSVPIALVGPAPAQPGAITTNYAQCLIVGIAHIGAGSQGSLGAMTGGSDGFFSIFTWDGATLRAQTTTIPTDANIKAIGLGSDGAGTMFATLNGALSGFSTQNFSGVPSVGCWPVTWVRGQAAVNCRLITDYMFAAGRRKVS